jgi:hypothetical protein
MTRTEEGSQRKMSGECWARGIIRGKGQAEIGRKFNSKNSFWRYKKKAVF